MKRSVIILFLLVHLSLEGVCQNYIQDTIGSFHINKVVPKIKVLYSKSNSLYFADNTMLMEGVDSVEIKKYFLKCLNSIAIYKQNSLFHLWFSDADISHNSITIPGKITIYILKIQSIDTVIIGSQDFNILSGSHPKPIIKIGKKTLTTSSIERKYLLANPLLSITGSNSDYDSTLVIYSFDILITNNVLHCKSNSLTPAIIDVLKKYNGNFISVKNIYVTTPQGKPMRIDSNSDN